MGGGKKKELGVSLPPRRGRRITTFDPKWNGPGGMVKTPERQFAKPGKTARFVMRRGDSKQPERGQQKKGIG